MSKRLENLNNIVGILNAGAKFYRNAARQVPTPELEQILLEHAELREEVARDISRTIDDAGGEPAEAAPIEQVRAAAAQVGTAFSDPSRTLVDSLEQHEDRTLEAFRQAIHHKDNYRDETALGEYMQRFEASHERMRALKHSKNPKAAAAEVQKSD